MSDERVVVMLPNGTWLVNDAEFLFFETEDDEPVALGTVWEFIEKLTGETNER